MMPQVSQNFVLPIIEHLNWNCLVGSALDLGEGRSEL